MIKNGNYMNIADKNNFKEIQPAKDYINAYAEVAGCTIFRINDTDRMANFMFIVNEPVPYVDIRGEISKQDYEKKKVASITMTYKQAEAFYLSLKKQFEGN